jgi:RNA polymerase sigma factor (sigma-70 family)
VGSAVMMPLGMADSTYQTKGAQVTRKQARQARNSAKKPQLRLVKNNKGSLKSSPRIKPKTLCLVNSIAKAGELTPFQQEALILKYRLKARKLGRSILRRWHSRMELDEVDSLVDLSLCEAVRRFDPTKGASFMTFLFYHLKGNLVRAVASATAASAIPLAIAELAEMTAFDADDHSRSRTIGINAVELAEAVSGQEAPQPDELLWRKELTDRSSSACEKLDVLEREIVKRIFVQEQQIIDIAAALGYSRCHISRVKKKALDTLQDELRAVMNHDDYALMDEHQPEELEAVHSRIASRKEVHRRRPRSASSAPVVENRAARAA